MVKAKIFFIRNKNYFYILLLLALIFLVYSLFPSCELTYDIWALLSSIFKGISDSKISPQWNHMTLTLLFISIPILILYSISSFIYPQKPWDILQKIGRKRKNTAIFSYLLLNKSVKEFSSMLDMLENGVPVLKENVNELQTLILPEITKTKIYATSLLEPSDIYADPELLSSVETNLRYAKRNNIILQRFLVTDYYSELVAKKDTATSEIYKLNELHKSYNSKLSIISENDFKTCWSAFGLSEDCLDFLLIENQVVFGLKNSKNDYKTDTDGNYFKLFVKDSKDDVSNYKKMINQVSTMATKLN